MPPKADCNMEIFRDRRGEWRARIRHTNSHILVITSESYKNRLDMLQALETVLRNAAHLRRQIKHLRRQTKENQ